MDEKTKKEFIQLFAQGFDEMVMPVIEDLRDELKDDIEKLRKETKAGFDRIENRIDFHAQKDAELERRVKKLESPAI